jgi:hypothetical protein
MHVLGLILGKIFSAKFSLSFCLFSVKRPDGLSWRLDGCGSVGQTVMLHIRTRMAPTFSSRRVNEPSGLGPHSLYKTWPPHFRSYPTPSLSLLTSSECVLVSFCIISYSFVLLCITLSFQVLF